MFYELARTGWTRWSLRSLPTQTFSDSKIKTSRKSGLCWGHSSKLQARTVLFSCRPINAPHAAQLPRCGHGQPASQRDEELEFVGVFLCFFLFPVCAEPCRGHALGQRVSPRSSHPARHPRLSPLPPLLPRSPRAGPASAASAALQGNPARENLGGFFASFECA